MTPILVDPTTNKAEIKTKENKRLAGFGTYDPATGVITWSTADMNQLKAAIQSSVNKNDALLNANQGDIKVAILKGYILINVDTGGMPNWNDIRKVTYLQATGAMKTRVWEAPREALMEAITQLDAENKLKRVEPKVVA